MIRTDDMDSDTGSVSKRDLDQKSKIKEFSKKNRPYHDFLVLVFEFIWLEYKINYIIISISVVKNVSDWFGKLIIQYVNRILLYQGCGSVCFSWIRIRFLSNNISNILFFRPSWKIRLMQILFSLWLDPDSVFLDGRIRNPPAVNAFPGLAFHTRISCIALNSVQKALSTNSLFVLLAQSLLWLWFFCSLFYFECKIYDGQDSSPILKQTNQRFIEYIMTFFFVAKHRYKSVCPSLTAIFVW